MRAKRKQLFPPPAHMAQCEAIDYLRRQVFDDAVAAQWLRPCARKEGRGKDSVFYNFADVQDVSLRIAAGEYPTRKELA
jgi:hypothetical protein